MSAWKPINSAPKDGSPILLWCPEKIDRREEVPGLSANTAIGFWLEGAWRSIEGEESGGSMGSSRTGWMSGSWEWIEVTPTHWMEMPDPPAQS